MKKFAELDEESQARVVAALHARQPVRTVEREFGLTAGALRRIAPKRHRTWRIEEDGEILDVIAAGVAQKWCERDPSKAAPLSPHGEAERQRRAEQAGGVDRLLQSLGLEPVSKTTPIVIQALRPARALSDLMQNGRGDMFGPRRRDDRERIPTIDSPPWPEDGDR